jgi:hypothetical protein
MHRAVAQRCIAAASSRATRASRRCPAPRGPPDGGGLVAPGAVENAGSRESSHETAALRAFWRPYRGRAIAESGVFD